MKWSNLYNPLISGMLRSPLHGLLSKHIALLTITGRNSGRRYTVPVSYTQQGVILHIFSKRNRTWWRNLRSGSCLEVQLGSEAVHGLGEPIEDSEAVADALNKYLEEHPDHARYYGVELNTQGGFARDQLIHATEDLVLVQVLLHQ